MKITAIKRQIRDKGRFSIFVEGKYLFSLGEGALLESRIALGQELSDKDIARLRQLADTDKLYNSVLGYLAIRPRSTWEVESYLKRKKAPPSLSESILNKLSNNKLLDDVSFAESFVRSRRATRPTSVRKLQFELQQKHVSKSVIQQVLAAEDNDVESNALAQLVVKKRQQTRYQDDVKLMQYLVRQGFSYDDVKQAVKTTEN